MKRLYSPYLFFLLLLLVAEQLQAQTSRSDPSDVQGWYGASATCSFKKGWGVYGNTQLRFVNNLRDYNVTYLSVGATKKLDKHFEVMGDYRLGMLPAAVYNRFTLGAEWSDKIKKLNVSVRFQIQNQLQEFDDTTKVNDNSGYWRVRFHAKYPIVKKLDVYASVEPIMKIGGIYYVDNIRNTIGLKYKVMKNLKLDLYYIYRPDYAKSYNRLFHVIGFNADYSFKAKKKGKKKKNS